MNKNTILKKIFKRPAVFMLNALLIAGLNISAAADVYAANEKTAEWTDETKEKADIEITYQSDINGVLWLGTLCSGHGLTDANTAEAMTEIAKTINIDYVFEGVNQGGASMAENLDQLNYLFNDRTFKDYSEYDEEEALKDVIYLLDGQRASGTLECGETMPKLTDLKDDTTGESIRLWSGFRNGWGSLRNDDMRAYVEEQLGRPAPLWRLESGFIYGEGRHGNAVAFARDIVEKLSVKEYDTVILSFDGLELMSCINDMDEEEVRTMRKAAEMLLPYYRNNKVIWLKQDPEPLRFADLSSYELTNGKTAPEAFNIGNARYISEQGGYESYSYLTNLGGIRNYVMNRLNEAYQTDGDDALGKVPKVYYTKMMFQTLALFDPETYLSNTDEDGRPLSGTLPSVSEWKTTMPNTASYATATSIVNMYNNSTQYNRYVIKDNVNDGLNPVSVDVFYTNAAGEEIRLEEGTQFETLIEGQEVTVYVNEPEAVGMPLRTVIHCDCPEGFDSDLEPKDTNVGAARVITYMDDRELRITEYESPKLLKVFNVRYYSDENGTVTGIEDEIRSYNDHPSGTEETASEGYKTLYWVNEEDVYDEDGNIISKGSRIADPRDVTIRRDTSFRVYHGPEEAEPVIEKDADRKEVYRDDIIKYTVKISSGSEGPSLKNAVMTDPLPEGVALIEDSVEASHEGAVITCADNEIKVTLPELEGDAEVTFKAKVRADEGLIRNTAYLKCDNSEEVSDDADVNVIRKKESSSVTPPKNNKTVKDSGTPKTEKKKAAPVETGDTSGLRAWLLICIGAAALILFMIQKNRGNRI